jgi:hypothetical protein
MGGRHEVTEPNWNELRAPGAASLPIVGGGSAIEHQQVAPAPTDAQRLEEIAALLLDEAE